jgi:multidrug efflux pump subunit AcrB
MWLVRFALRRPVTTFVAMVAVALASALAIQRMAVDIFPSLGSPTVFVAQPYGGMDPQQMEGFLTYYYEYHFLYITGIEHVESKSIQGAALMKLVFHPGTDMSQAMAEVVGYVNRARAFMPPGAVPPFVVRYDAGSVPVGQLVFSSAVRSPAEMQDFALNRVRPLFATLPGVSAPPPFGGNQKTVVVRLDPDRLREYRISPDEATAAVTRASVVMPSGNVRTGDLMRIASTNASLGADMNELLDAPVRTGSGPTVYVRDLGTVEVGTDIVTGYAHVNGRRTVYIPVTKRADASTLSVIRRVRAELPRMQQVVPQDVEIRLEFDQSRYVVAALRGLAFEASLGALLTGATVLLFLGDWRSSTIVVATIPFALLGALVGLWSLGQTINIMTLGGLALAVGVLVDEATVSIESVHSLLGEGMSRARAVVEASRRTAVPRLLAMACVLSVFVPSFFMVGVGRQLFVPLSLAVGLAMIASYVLSSTFVPVLAARVPGAGRERDAHDGWIAWMRSRYERALRPVLAYPSLVIAGYLVATTAIIVLLLPRFATEIFPSVETGQLQVRLRAPTGTRIERTEVIALRAIEIIKREVGDENVEISTGFIGVQPASYPINTIYLFTSGPHEAVMQVALKPQAALHGEALKERLRQSFARELPQVGVSFEAADIIGQVMSFGSPTPIEVAVQGPDLAADRAYAATVHDMLAALPFLRDLQYAQPMDYPTMEIDIDRQRAGQLGLTTTNVARSLVAATSSSRFVEPNYWRDPASGNAFQIQVEVPQYRMASSEDVESLPLATPAGGAALVSDVAHVKLGTTMGLIQRYNMQRVVSVTANIHGVSLGEAARAMNAALARMPAPPRGVTLNVRGQMPAFAETVSGLQTGLLLAVFGIFLLLAANFQSFGLAFAVLSTIPAVLCGVLLLLLVTRTTLNVQSFMGAIMAMGIAVANAILLVTFAESARATGIPAVDAAVQGSGGRVRAILMTASAMIAGMLPMAIGVGSGGQESAPLGRAVVGGLVFATVATLFVVPSVYARLQRRAGVRSASLDPDDPLSRYYDAQ